MDIDLELVTKTERHLSETIARFKNNLKLCDKLPDGGKRLRAEIKRHEYELERRRSLPLGLVMKSDHEIEEAIAWFRTNLKLCDKLRDGGDRLRANIKLYEHELQRRQLLAMVVDNDECEETIQVSDDNVEHTSIHNHHRMEQHRTKRQRPTVLTLDWEKLVVKVISNKSDRELSESVARIKSNLKVCGKLRDGGERLRANLKRHEDELERRQLLAQVDNDCEENIQVSDDGAAEHTSIHNDHRMGVDLELVSKSERQLSETIARFKNNLKLCGKLRDGGERLRANLKRYEDELQRRQLLAEVDNECEEPIQVSDDDAAEHTSVHNHHRMEIGCCKRKEPTLLTPGRNKLSQLSTDCLPEIIMTSKSPENCYQTEDLELVMKSDRELNETIAKLRANLKRHQGELQRRLLLNKGM